MLCTPGCADRRDICARTTDLVPSVSNLLRFGTDAGIRSGLSGLPMGTRTFFLFPLRDHRHCAFIDEAGQSSGGAISSFSRGANQAINSFELTRSFYPTDSGLRAQ